MQPVKNKTVYRNSFNFLRGLLDMLMEIPVRLRGTPMIEIGSGIGESTRIFSLFFSPVYSIDPLPNVDSKAEFIKMTRGRNIINISKFSFEAINYVPDKVSFVYIDGNHKYNAVKEDIKNYLPKIISGGFIGGHDYQNSGNIEVEPAVNELLGKPDKIFIDHSWIKQI